MITKVFGIYDTKALCYGSPYFMPTVGSAVRAFSDLSNDKNSSVNKHPSDYMLMQIGEFDDSNGVLVSQLPPKNLGLASDFVTPAMPGIEQFEIPFNNGKKTPVEVK